MCTIAIENYQFGTIPAEGIYVYRYLCVYDLLIPAEGTIPASSKPSQSQRAKRVGRQVW